MTIADYTAAKTDWIMYDFNRGFAQIEFIGAPVDSLICSHEFIATDPTLLGLRHSVYLSVTATVKIRRGARIVIRMIDSDYQFEGDYCTSETVDVLDPLTSVTKTYQSYSSEEYSCQIDHSKNAIIVELSVDLQPNFERRFRFSMRNPKYVKSLSGGFEIFTMLQQANAIVERGKIDNIFQTSKLAFGWFSTLFSWGLNRTDITLVLPVQITIYRSKSTDPNHFFNSFKFFFNVKTDTPINLKLRVTLRLDGDLQTNILEGSIAENLPSFDNSPVLCSVNSMKIICDNVGTLKFGKEYHIAARVSFFQIPPVAPSVIWAEANLATTFGRFKVETLSDQQNIDPNPLIDEAGDTVPVWKTKNIYDLLYQNQNNGFTFVHSQPMSSPLAAVTNQNYGLKSIDGVQQRIIFTTFAKQTDYIATTTPVIGVDIYTSPAIKPATQTFTAETLSTGSFAVPAAKVETNSIYTRMRTGVTQSVDLFQIFGGAATALKTFSIGPFYIFQNSTLYCDEKVIDFYGGTFEDLYTDPQGFQIKWFAYNSYLISGQSVMSNLHLTVSNFWTGDATMNLRLDGTKFPAFIRVTGAMSVQELKNVQRLAIFFNDLEPFDESINDFGKIEIACTSTLNVYQKCFRFPGDSNSKQSIFSLPRIEFDVYNTIERSGPSSPFQLLIPVKTIVNKGTLVLQIATLIKHDDYMTNKLYSIVQDVKSFFSFNLFTPKTGPPNAIQSHPLVVSQSYKFNYDPTQDTVGLQEAKAAFQIIHDDQSNPDIILPNTATAFGAAFFYQGIWPMIGTTFYATSNFINNNLNSEKCVGYNYLVSGTRYYGFYCPMSYSSISILAPTDLTAYSFNFFKTEKMPLGTWAGWSSNDGQMQSFASDSQVATLKLGTLTLPVESVYKVTIQSKMLDQVIEWQFQTQNEMPSGSNVLIEIPAISWPFSVDTTAKCVLISNPIIAHACSIASIVQLSITFTITSISGYSFLPGVYSIRQYGVDMPTQNQGTQAYDITTIYNGEKIDKVTAGNVFYINDLLDTPVILQSIDFTQTNTVARGDFKMKVNKENNQIQFLFQNRGVLSHQQLVINLGLLTAVNQISQMLCHMIKDDGLASFDWVSMNYNNFDTIIVKPRGDLDKDQIYGIVCHNTITPGSSTDPTLSPKVTVKSSIEFLQICLFSCPTYEFLINTASINFRRPTTHDPS